MEIAATLPMDDQESLEARFEEIDLENVESQLNKLSSKLTNSLKNFNTLKQGATENAKRSKELVDYKLEFPISIEEAKYQLETVQVSAHLDGYFVLVPELWIWVSFFRKNRKHVLVIVRAHIEALWRLEMKQDCSYIRAKPWMFPLSLNLYRIVFGEYWLNKKTTPSINIRFSSKSRTIKNLGFSRWICIYSPKLNLIIDFSQR